MKKKFAVIPGVTRCGDYVDASGVLTRGGVCFQDGRRGRVANGYYISDSGSANFVCETCRDMHLRHSEENNGTAFEYHEAKDGVFFPYDDTTSLAYQAQHQCPDCGRHRTVTQLEDGSWYCEHCEHAFPKDYFVSIPFEVVRIVESTCSGCGHTIADHGNKRGQPCAKPGCVCLMWG